MGKWLDKAGLQQIKGLLATKFSTKVDKYPGVGAGKYLQTDNNGNAFWGDPVSVNDIRDATEDWLDTNMSNIDSTVALDTSLTTSGAAADAKSAGDLIEVSDTTPASGPNKLWIKKTPGDEVTVPTYDEFTDLKGAFNAFEDETFDFHTGLNLLNPNLVVAGTINSTTGAVESNSYYGVSGKIPCEPGDKVYIYIQSGSLMSARKGTYCRVAFYASDDSLKGYDSNQDYFTAPADSAYFRVEDYVNAIKNEKKIGAFNNPTSVIGTSWIPYEDWRTLKYDALPQDAKDELESISTEYMRIGTYIDYSMVNRLDPSECETGEIIIYTGATDPNASYFTTDYMPIRPGETLYFYGIRNEAANAKRIAGYDKGKNFIQGSYVDGSPQYVEQSGEMAYIRASFAYSASDYYNTPDGKACLANAKPPFIPGYGQTPVIKSDYIRTIIWVYATDTESQIITKLINAYKIGNCDVYFERADYSFGTELAKVSTDYGMQYNEIPIGNNCRYFFNGATLTATLDLSQLTPAPGDDEFYCNFFGCQRIPSSYEMYDGVLSATDTRYIVHDESSHLKGTFKHIYQNLEMHYHTDARQENIRKCIGGGTGVDGVIEIEDCKFTTDGTDVCVAYHGNSVDVSGSKFDINVRDSWFSNGIRAGELSTNQTARLFYTGNSAAQEPQTYTGWTVTSFINEIRN